MNNKKELVPKRLINEKELLNSYSEYLQLIKKYKERFEDKNIQPDSKLDLKYQILEYFKFKYENGEKWIDHLISIIKRQYFLSQNLLISIFYIDVYDLIIKPKFLNVAATQMLYPQSEVFMYETIKNKESEDPTILFKIKRQESYELFRVIKRQIEYKENPFNIVINNFISSFLNEVQYKDKYLDKIKDKKDFAYICEKYFEELKEQINEFIILLTKCFTLLYKINNIQEYDTYYALLISIIFNGKENSQKLYQSFMNIISKKVKSKTDKFKKVISYYENNSLNKPQDFLVEDKFCLNEKSKQLYEDLFKNQYNSGFGGLPYENTINNYRKIKEYENPFDKLLVTSKLSKSVADDINKFWSLVKENDLQKEKLKLNIEADDFISIFKYILIRGEIEDIHSQICFIESFTSNQIKSESEWYYLSLIQVGLMQLEEMKDL